MAKSIDPARLFKVLRYEPDSGLFYRLSTGKIAGSKDKRGYVTLCVDSVRGKAHRLAFVFMLGGYPDGHVDHIDGDPSNNRWSNLRAVTPAVNTQNQRHARVNSKAGRLGVYEQIPGRWRAQICAFGRRISLGVYSSAEEAQAVYVAAKRKLHPGCTI